MKTMFSAALCLMLVVTLVSAQQNKPLITVSDIKVSLTPAPTYNLDTVPTGMSQPRQDASMKWLDIEAELESTIPWADEVTVKFYVVAQYGAETYVNNRPAKSLPNEDQYDILTTTVQIVNVQKNESTGKKIIVPVFVDPSTVKRYGEGNLKKFVPEVAVEVQYQGTVQHIKWMAGDEQKPGRFWEKKQARTGILLNVLQSPWWPAFSDQYQRVKTVGTPPSL